MEQMSFPSLHPTYLNDYGLPVLHFKLGSNLITFRFRDETARRHRPIDHLCGNAWVYAVSRRGGEEAISEYEFGLDSAGEPFQPMPAIGRIVERKDKGHTRFSDDGTEY